MIDHISEIRLEEEKPVTCDISPLFFTSQNQDRLIVMGQTGTGRVGRPEARRATQQHQWRCSIPEGLQFPQIEERPALSAGRRSALPSRTRRH
jgi:hypothetical protein